MKVYLIIITSMLLQFLAVYLALKLMRITGKITAWIFIAGAIIFMALRRGLLLYGAITESVVFMPTDVTAEIIALVTSALMAIGLGLIAPLFLKVTRSEAALQESEKRFRDITENAVEWFWEVDQLGKYTYSSPAVEQLLGYKPDEVIGKHFYDFFLPEEREELKNAAFEVLDTGKTFQGFINRNLHKRGEIVWLSTSGIPILDGKGNTLGYRGVDIDISRHKQAEEALHRASLYNRSLIEANFDPLVTIGKDGKIMDVNQATENVTGVPRNRLIGKDFADFFTDPEKAREGYEQVFAQGGVKDYPLALRHVSGSITYVLYNASVYKNELGEVQGVFAAARDITARKQVEGALEQKILELGRSNAALEEFAYAASHDLQEPLRKIINFTELLMKRYKGHLDDKAEKYLWYVVDGAARMQQLINDLLSNLSDLFLARYALIW